jgi:DNA-binding phage protein
MKVTIRDWKVDDYLKTPEERAAYIQAAAEEGTPDAIPDAFADVFRAMGLEDVAKLCEGLATYLRAVPSLGKPTTKTARRKTRKRVAAGV